MEESQNNPVPEEQQPNLDPELNNIGSEDPVIIPSSHRVRSLRRSRKKGFGSAGLLFLSGIIIGLAGASVVWYSLDFRSQKQIETIEIERTADAMVHTAEIGAFQETISELEVFTTAQEKNSATLQAGRDTAEENLAMAVALITPSVTLVPTRTASPTPTPLLLRTVIPTLTMSGSGENESLSVQQLPVTDSMVLIPAGNFEMGSEAANAQTDEKPLHEVWLKEYWIDKTPVTNGDYQRCVESGICSDPVVKSSRTRPDYYGNSIYDNYPVVNVDWNQATTYCIWLGKRLPTEAEWEKAAKGNDNRTYPWGEIAPDEYRLNFDNQIGDTVEVGKYLAGKSPYGVLDLAGNVWEWVSDWYDEAYYQNLGGALVSNPSGPSEGSYRVLRGGSYGSNAWYVRVSARSGNAENSVSNSRGFRCAYAKDE